MKPRTRNLLWILIFVLVFIAGAIWFSGSVRKDTRVHDEDVPEPPAEMVVPLQG